MIPSVSDRVNVIVLSDAGKPIFSLRDDDEDAANTTQVCGLLQAVCTSIGHSSLEDEIQTLETDSMIMVFMVAGSITLVAIATAPRHSGESLETEAYLRLQLEFVYAQIIFHFTDQIQLVFAQNASFDLRSLWQGSGDSMMRNMLRQALLTQSGCDAIEDSTSFHPAPFLTAGVQTFGPIPHSVRDHASIVLQLVRNDTNNAFLAMLMVGDKLLTLVQSSHVPHQLMAADLHLLMHFVYRQRLTSELWLPLCLPRFNSSGFMHCYLNCMDSTTRFTLVLLSQEGSTEQFQAFSVAACRARRFLGIPMGDCSILEILASDSSQHKEISRDDSVNDVQWRRSIDTSNVIGLDEDYEIIPYFDAANGYISDSSCNNFFYELTSAVNAEAIERKLADLMDSCASGIVHFCIRLDVPTIKEKEVRSRQVRTSHVKAHDLQQNGRLTQCLTSQIPFSDYASKRRLLGAYQRLHLRLHLGYSRFDPVRYKSSNEKDRINGFTTSPTIGLNCPSMYLSESQPLIEGFTYITQLDETFLAMNGRGFELYVMAKASCPVEHIASAGAKLVRSILAEEQTLFLSNPRTWNLERNG